LIASAILFLAPWLRGTVDFAADWGGKFIQVPVISEFLPGILFDPEGEYQSNDKGVLCIRILPCFSLTCLSADWARGRTTHRGQTDEMRCAFLLIINYFMIFHAFNATYASLLNPISSYTKDYIAPFSVFPNSNPMVYLQIGQVLFLFALMYYYYDGRVTVPQTGVFVKWFKRMSRHSLTVYLVHYPLIPWSSSGS